MNNDRDMSTGSFISFFLILALIVAVSALVKSKLSDLQRRVGQLEQQVDRR